MTDQQKTKQQLIAEINELKAKLRDKETIAQTFFCTAEALKQSAESTQDTMVRFDDEYRLLYVNPAIEKLTGMATKDLVGTSFFDYDLPKELTRIWKSTLDKVFASGEQQRVEFKLPNETWIDWVCVPEKSDQGRIETVMTSARDITQIKQAQLALQESETRFRVLAQCTHSAIFIIHQDRFLYVNPATAQISEYSEQELLNLPFHAIIHPDFQQMVIKRAELRQKGEDPPSHYEFIVLTKNGKEKWVDLSTARIEFQQKSAIIGTAFDITTRKRFEESLKESEAKYRLLAESVTDIIWTFNLNDLSISYINPSAHGILGYNPQEMIGLTLKDLLTSESYERATKVISEQVEKDKLKKTVPQVLELELIDTHGKGVWTESTTRFLRDSKGKLYGVLGVTRDIRKRKKAEEERKLLESSLQNAKKMESIATLAGGIAHEFNNALVGITGNIELMQMEMADRREEEIVKYINRMKKSAHRMVNLTKQLLAYARGGKYQSKDIDLNLFVEDSLSLIKYDIDPAIRLETDLRSHIPRIKGDFTQLQMALLAIVANAREAIENNGRIRISTRDMIIDQEFSIHNPGLKPGHYALLTVEDDGKGMDKATMEKIFEPFFTSKFQGRGLGMAAVYGIVKNHEGWICAESEPGNGTRILIYLPTINQKKQDANQPFSSPSSSV